MARDPRRARPVATPRVKVVQRQTRLALRMAMVFAFAAVASIFVPHHTGAWLPLHLFLVGALLLAVSGATRLFAVTWSAAEPVGDRIVAAQRWLIGAGAVGLAVGRERALPTALVAVAGLCVTAGLVLLGGLLAVESRRAAVRRYHPAVHFYLVAVTAGVVGTGLGAAMVTGRGEFRDAHLIVNLLGLLGLVIAGTLPFFVATQARMKMSRRATPCRLHANLGWSAGAITLAAGATVTRHPAVAGVALVGCAAGIGHLVTLLPRPGRKQLAWAGPRLLQLAAGLAWWCAVVLVAAGRTLAGRAPFPERLVVALVVGGYAQILLGSLAYLGPVLRGGGHVRLTAGFALTRSWIAVVAGNLAAIAWVAGRPRLAVVFVAALTLDVAVRTAALARRPGSDAAAPSDEAAPSDDAPSAVRS